MPFTVDTEDTYTFGIQGAAHDAGLLCERADMSSFTGDVVSWVKNRIAGSTLIIADLIGGSPNVYLEVGYAWGRNRPTILLVRQGEDLMFDVRGQRCLVYRNIKQLNADRPTTAGIVAAGPRRVKREATRPTVVRTGRTRASAAPLSVRRGRPCPGSPRAAVRARRDAR
jgi:hypothetical protein